jgi:hypothetical protein
MPPLCSASNRTADFSKGFSAGFIEAEKQYWLPVGEFLFIPY